MSEDPPTPAPPSARTARVRGEPMIELPEDLYIPPDALEVFLEAFEGPLDLLLYLIRKQNIDILDIPVLAITRQYVEYVELMRELKLELAAEYLVMAAWLAEIKSRILLPRPMVTEETLDDPRAELVRRLQEYERFKRAGERLDELPRVGREIVPVRLFAEPAPSSTPIPVPAMRELLLALRDALTRAELFNHHRIQREPLSVRERMGHLLGRLRSGPASFVSLVDVAEGRAGVVVCLLAVLELVKGAMVEVVQKAPFTEFTIRLARPTAVPEDATE
jgi:segregation and condensation protein A